MWASIHGDAVVACEDKAGSYSGRVVPVTYGSSCDTTCRTYSNGWTCRGVVTFSGKMGHTTSSTDVGYWRNNYSCSTTSIIYSEVSEDEGFILTYNYHTYCCCGQG